MSSSAVQNLKSEYLEGSERLRSEFESTRSGRSTMLGRTSLIDSLVHQLWQHHVDRNLSGPEGFALVAIGGYGRGLLCPYSDVDLLFLCDNEATASARKENIRALSQDMWDLRIKLSPTTRTLDDCDRLHRDNPEFNISLLDCRFLAGDFSLFRNLHDQVIPRVVLRDWQEMVSLLADVNEGRRKQAGDTIFHLEPNIKDGPGGLRDYHLACWLGLLNGFSRSRDWTAPQDSFPASLRDRAQDAVDFLLTVRCFLHYRSGRDDNQLSWEAQQAAADEHVGYDDGTMDAAEWMRYFYRHARVINRLASLLLDEVVPARSSLYQQFQNWRSRLSNADFAAVNGRVYVQQPSALVSPDLFFRSFEFVATHGLKLASSTDQRIEISLASIAALDLPGPKRWDALRSVLVQPHAALALRSMQELGVLGLLLPDFRAVESLVIRDYYHRYTVDEHTFRAVDAIHSLDQSASDFNRGLAEIKKEIERLDLLILALLLHDLGKAEPSDDHVSASLEVAMRVCSDFGLPEADSEMVCFLVAYHLDVSASMRRDIFDPATVQALGRRIGSPERLKMLTLLTYADISAVNPVALTPWKAENLWRLYTATANFLDRSVDTDRYHSVGEDEQLARIRLLAPQLGRKLREFLEGLPQRYLRMHTADDIISHVTLASQLKNKVVQSQLRRTRGDFEITLITQDRPALFATLAGILAGWGMNILKADAFSNDAGVIVDRFVFSDRFHTLEMNMQEWERFQNSFRDVLSGDVPLQALARKRAGAAARVPKVHVEPSLNFDQNSSQYSTVLEVVAQDRAGLLYEMASRFSDFGCNIEIALIDTQGERAIDTFYLTVSGNKLDAEQCSALKSALLPVLSGQS